MEEYEAKFEIESSSDARAIERVLTRLYDSLREESRTTREGANSSTEMLEQFETLRDAARDHRSGTLRVVYTRDEEPIDGAE